MSNFKVIQRKLDTIQNLPTLPAILTKLEGAVRNPDSSAKDIANIIEDDPAIMSRILKVVNSAFYGSPSNPINSLQFAVARLGMRAISNIALSTAVFSAFSSNSSADFDRKEFWKHSICTGIGVNILYNRCKQNLNYRYDKDLLHLAGLVHGIGKIVLDQYFHADFVEALNICAEQECSLAVAEVQVLGCDHAEVGSWLGKKWNLSAEILQVLRWHLEPYSAAKQYQELVILCHIANYICNLEKLGNSGDIIAPSCHHSTLKDLSLKVSDITDIIDEIKEESKNSEVLLSFV